MVKNEPQPSSPLPPADLVGTAAKTQRIPAPEDYSRDTLVSVAVLGLIACVADGEPHAAELHCFRRAFSKQFGLSERFAARLIKVGLHRLQRYDSETVIDEVCGDLNRSLTYHQKLTHFSSLADVLVADGRVHPLEEHFLDSVARKLGLAQAERLFLEG